MIMEQTFYRRSSLVDPENNAAFEAHEDQPAEGMEAEGAESSDEQEPRSYTEDELQTHVREATSAVQSSKDRRIASLEAQIRQMQADVPVPQFRNAEEELGWHRQQRAQAAAIRKTEANISTALGDLSDRIGVEIKRDDPRLDLRTAESFETSLAAIERETELRKQLPSKKPAAKDSTTGQAKRQDTHRFDGGSGGARQTYNPKKFEGTGDVFGALQAKRAAGLR